MQSKKRDEWPDNYKEPEWLGALEHRMKIPTPSWMFRRLLLGAGIAAAACGLFSFDRNHLIWAGCILIFYGSFRWSELTDEPPLLLQKWIQERARADAWEGMPWSVGQKRDLADCVRWSRNWSENRADEVGEKRKRSILWRLLHGALRVELRPKPFRSGQIMYEELLMEAIEAAERQAAWKHERKDPSSPYFKGK